MGLFDAFLNTMKLSSEEDEFEVDEEEEMDEEPVKKQPKKAPHFKQEAEEEVEEDTSRFAPKAKASKPAPKPAPSGKVVRYNRNSGMEVCVFKPNNIEEGREISDTLLEGKAVILNLEGIDVSLAQRIIDFTSGACYSIRGNLQKISGSIFIVTPESVDISGDFQELMSNSDYSFNSGNVY